MWTYAMQSAEQVSLMLRVLLLPQKKREGKGKERARTHKNHRHHPKSNCEFEKRKTVREHPSGVDQRS
jgi:hypothetical protein